MPIEYWIDHTRRLVMAKGHGTLSDQDVFGYQTEVWSCPDVAGYDELMDMTDVEQIALPSTQRMRHLAELSAAMDAPLSASRFAIVAPQDVAFGMGRMFETLRSMDDRSTKQVGVFRSLADAFAFLGIEERGVT